MGNRWLWALGLLLVLAGGTVYFWMQPHPMAGEDSVRILILGLDEVESRSRSDTIIVAQVDAQGAVLLSIPRDLRVKFPDGQLRKINAAYAMGAASGNPKKGADLARQVISEFLGLSLPYYVVVDFEGFQQAVDQLGGVEINIQERMVYDDGAQNLHINFEPGLQLLNGEQALQYARYRGQSGDLQRIERQQQIVKAILQKQNASMSAFDRIKSLLEMALTHVKSTNLTLPDLVSLARQLQEYDLNTMTTLNLSGDNVLDGGISYLDPKIVKNTVLVDRWLRHKEFLLPSDVQVIILNGNGTSGLANVIKSELKARDFQVTYAGNAENFNYPTTLAVIMNGPDSKAQLVADVLGTGQVVHHEIEAVIEHLQAIRSECVQNQGCNFEAFNSADVVFIAGQDFVFSQ